MVLVCPGASVNAQTFTKGTALTYACENGHTEVAAVLIHHGAVLVSALRVCVICMDHVVCGHYIDVKVDDAAAPLYEATSSYKHEVIACVVKESHSFACTGTHLFANGMNRIVLCLQRFLAHLNLSLRSLI